MDTSNKRYDVIIVGGGMVGAAAACGLAEADLDVAVVEQHEPQREWPAEEIDLRVSAINRGSQQLLDNLGAWQGIVRRGVQPYREMRVWDNLDMGDIHFDSAAIGEADLGHIIQNRTIVAALWEQMENLANIRLYASTTVEKTLAGSDAISVMLRVMDHVTAKGAVAESYPDIPVFVGELAPSPLSYLQQLLPLYLQYLLHLLQPMWILNHQSIPSFHPSGDNR